MTLTLSKSQLTALKPCDLAAKLERFGDKDELNAQEALDAGFSVSDLCWAAGRHSEDSRKRIVGFAIDCAQSVAHLNADLRVQAAIDAAKTCWADPSDVNRKAAEARAARAAEAAAAAAAEARAAEAAAAAAAAEAREAAEAAAAEAREAAAAAAWAEAWAARAVEAWQRDRLVYWLSAEAPVFATAEELPR